MLKIHYDLAGTGWAECVVSCNKKKFMVTASYLGNALDELMQATLDILGGKEKARADFEEEPGQYRWIFRCINEDVSIKILKFGDFWSKEPDKRGRLLLAFTCGKEEFKNAMIDCFEDFRKRYSPKRYENLWCSPFPEYLYNEIKMIRK